MSLESVSASEDVIGNLLESCIISIFCVLQSSFTDLKPIFAFFGPAHYVVKCDVEWCWRKNAALVTASLYINVFCVLALNSDTGHNALM